MKKDGVMAILIEACKSRPYHLFELVLKLREADLISVLEARNILGLND